MKWLWELIKKVFGTVQNPTKDPDKPEVKVTVTVPIESTGAPKNVKMAPKDYTAWVRPFAQKVLEQFGIPIIITTTQSAHESNWGNSQLNKLGNNYFGMTKGSWTGAIISFPSTEFSPLPPDKIRYWNRPGDIISKKPNGKGTVLVVDIDFRRYATPVDSFIDWANHIKSGYPQAYAAALANDVPNFFAEVGKKYGTDQNYKNSCLALVPKVTEAMA